jgi:hypothetical protein
MTALVIPVVFLVVLVVSGALSEIFFEGSE